MLSMCYLTTLSTASEMPEYVWSFGTVILKGEKRTTMRKTFPSAILSTTNTTMTYVAMRDVTKHITGSSILANQTLRRLQNSQ
jgi:hypothetical protein